MICLFNKITNPVSRTHKRTGINNVMFVYSENIKVMIFVCLSWLALIKQEAKKLKGAT